MSNKKPLRVRIGPHRLYRGRCEHWLPRIPDKKIDFVLADPPYGTTLIRWDKIIDFAWLWPELRRVCGARYAMFASQPFTSKLLLSNEKQFSHELIWSKTITGNPFLAKKMPLKKHEQILVFGRGPYTPQMVPGDPYFRASAVRNREVKNDHKYGARMRTETDNKGERYPGSVLHFGREWRRQDQVHPTQKPVKLCRWLLRSYCTAGFSVLDFSMGSGSTGVACIEEAELGLSFVGIENDPKHFDTAVERITLAYQNQLG